MTDQSEAIGLPTTGTGPIEPATQETAQPETAQQFTLDSVERKFYGPAQMELAQAKVNEVKTHIPKEYVRWNFDPATTQVPAGYGIAIVPTSKRHESGKGNVRTGVVIAAMPSAETVAQHEKGAEFISETVTDYFMAKCANAVRPRDDGTTGTLPFEITAFIERKRGAASLKTFTEMAKAFVDALKKSGFTGMSQLLLKQLLQSKAFAEQYSAKHENNGFWDKVLERMIAGAKEKGLDPAILVNWAETREQIEFSVAEDTDIAALDAMLGFGDDDQGETETETVAAQ